MKRFLILIGLAAMLSLTGLAAGGLARAGSVVSMTTIDTHGNTAEYLEKLADTLALVRDLTGGNATTRVWRAEYAGRGAGMIYVGFEYADMAALVAGGAALDASEDFGKSIARLAKTGRTVVATAILRDVTPE